MNAPRAISLALLGMLVGWACTPAADGLCLQGDPRRFPATGPPFTDGDGDGLDDTFETNLVRANLPFLARHPDDRCPTAGIVFRAHPHPDDARLVHVAFTTLYATDCGLNGHVGDNEAFGATIDPRLPPPAGLTALVAISHQGTPCERTTTCGTCEDLPACDVAEGRPVLYASRDKHAGVVDVAGGCSFGSCFDACALPLQSADLPLVNAGEPDHPLVTDLSDPDSGQGFIDDTWPAILQHHDPWSGVLFGSAGVIAHDLVDDALVPPACSCVSPRE